MAGNTKDLTLKFKVTDEGTVVLDKISQKIGNVDQSAKKMNSSLSVIKLDALIRLGTIAVNIGKTMFDIARSTAAAGDEIARNARIVDMTTKQYQEWQYVAMRADVEATQLATGMKILSRNMYEAAEGGKEAVETFNALGVSVTDESGRMKSFNQIFEEMAQAFNKMPEGPEKVALALKAFGRSGEALIPLMNRGVEGIKAYREEFEKLGIEISEKTIRQLEIADEQFERFEAKSKSTWTKLKANFSAGLGAILEVFTRLSAGEGLKDVILGMQTLYNIAAQEVTPARWVTDWVKNEYLPNKSRFLDDINKKKQKENSLDKEAEQARKEGLEYVKKLKDYYDLLEGSTDKRVKAEEEYQRIIKEIPPEDPERQKKVQAAIDQWLEGIKQIEREIEKAKPVEIKVSTDQAEQELNAFIEKMQARGIKLPVSIISGGGGGSIWNTPNAEGNLPYMAPGGTPTYEKLEANVAFTGSGLSPKIPLGEAFDKIEERMAYIKKIGSGLTVQIAFYGEGSTRKPIIEKIREIIAEYGGLENAMRSMEAEINLEQLTQQYSKLERTLASVNRYPQEISNMLSAGGNPMGWYSIQPAFWNQFREQQADLTGQMKLLRMQMNYQYMLAYGGSMQEGGAVPFTGLYKLHRGEKVIPQNNVAIAGINITINGTRDPRTTADELVKVLKYRLSGELRGLI